MSKGMGIRNSGEILSFPDYTQAVVLATGSSNAQAFDVPTGMAFACFAFNADVWVKYGSTAVVIPSTSTTAGSSTPELNPTTRNLGSTQSCTGISLASEYVTKGSINWYKPA